MPLLSTKEKNSSFVPVSRLGGFGFLSGQRLAYVAYLSSLILAMPALSTVPSLIQMPHSSTASIAAWPFFQQWCPSRKTSAWDCGGLCWCVKWNKCTFFKLQHWLSQKLHSVSAHSFLSSDEEKDSHYIQFSDAKYKSSGLHASDWLLNPQSLSSPSRSQTKGLVQPMFCVLVFRFAILTFFVPAARNPILSEVIRFIMFVGVPVLGLRSFVVTTGSYERSSMRSSKQECKWKLNLEIEKKKITVLLMATYTACDPGRRWLSMFLLLITAIRCSAVPTSSLKTGSTLLHSAKSRNTEISKLKWNKLETTSWR